MGPRANGRAPVEVSVGRAGVPAADRRSLVAASLAVVAALVGAAALAGVGQHWSVGGDAGGLAAYGSWAVAVVVAWLVAAGAAAGAVGVVRAGPVVPDRVATPEAAGALAWRARLAVGVVLTAVLAVTAVVAAAATVRLVRGLVDDTTVATMSVATSAWVAPAALVVAVVIGAGVLGSWRRWAVVAGLVLALVAAMLVGAWPPAPLNGQLTGGGTAVAFRPGHRAPGFGVQAVASLGEAVYGVSDTTVQAIDERGRWFPLGPLDDLRPAGYVGHRTRPSDDVIDGADLVGFFEREGQLVLATRRGGLFTAFGDRPGRMLATVPTDRTPASLAALAAQGAVLLPEDAEVEGAGPDGRGGVLVATTAGLVRIPPTGAVEPIAAADALLAGPPTADGVRVVGRADGSIVLVQRCAVHELAAGAAAFVEVVRWQGEACSGAGPAPVTVAADGELVMAIEDGRSVRGASSVAQVGRRPPAAVAVDAEGRFVVAYGPDGLLLRSPARPRA